MRRRRCQFDMAHALAAHFGQRHFNAAFFADNAAVLQALVFTAKAFVIFERTENLGAEQAIAFRLERTIVDGFRLFDFAVRPLTDFLGRRETNLDRVELFVLLNLLE